MDKNFKVKVDDSFEYNLKRSDADHLDLLKISNSKFHVIFNNKTYNIELKNQDFYKREYVVKINGRKSQSVKISNQLAIQIKEMGFSSGLNKKENNIKAPMPGLVLSVNVKEGQEVKEGDTLLILEAMKMENAISAPKDGIIKQITTKDGGTVEKGELMIEMA